MNGSAASQLMDVLADPEALKQNLARFQDAESRAKAQIETTRQEMERLEAACARACDDMRSTASASAQTTISEANVIKADASELLVDAETVRVAAAAQTQQAAERAHQLDSREAQLQAQAKQLESEAQALEQEKQRVADVSADLFAAVSAAQQFVK